MPARRRFSILLRAGKATCRVPPVTSTLGLMISFDIKPYRFHYRAAAIVLDDGSLLLHRLRGDKFWALPGGRVEAGESAEEAISREFQEELGLAAECKQLACTGENFFEYDNQPHHEIGLCFYVALPADSEINEKDRIHIGVEGDKRLEFRWYALQDLPIIDMRPRALRQSLTAGTVPGHFVQRGGQ